MQLQDIFTPSTIKLDLESEDKDEVFEELVDVMVNAHQLKVRTEILEAIHDRESKMSTGIRDGIAVPHGKTDVVSQLLGVIGLSKQGIDYDALDGKPVHLLFLLVSPADQSGPHLKMLRNIAVLLEQPKFCDDMLTASSAEQLYRRLVGHENALRVQE